MKALICCLNSKYVHASLAPWCLAAGVETFGKTVTHAEVMESTVNADMVAFSEKITEKEPTLVSFSCYIWNITKTLELCRMIRSRCDCTIVLGGPEVAYRPNDVLETYEFVDLVLSGEGEESFPKLLDTLNTDGDLHSVPGLSFRSTDGIVSVPEAELVGTPPSPVTDEMLSALNGRISYIETSRGCPYRCAFCLSGRCSALRFFDMEQVKTDIIRLAESGTKTVKFVDRTFNANADRADEILLFIKENYGTLIPSGVCFHFEIAGDILRDSTLEILSSMPHGAVQLEIGMQTFNEESLKLINRKTNTQKLIRNIKKLLSFGNMHIHIDLIAGLTGEDILSFERSFNIGFDLKAHMLQMGFLKLLYGAEMRRDRDKYPCEFSIQPPYEVISTPWLYENEIKMLKNCEDAVERLYNSGRFLKTLEYLTDEVGFTPFRLFNEFGNTFSGEKLSLKKYAECVYTYFKDFCDADILRDKMVTDMLLCGASEHIPDILKVYDPLYKKAKKVFGGDKGIALLYTQRKILVVSKAQPYDLFGRRTGEYFELADLEV